MRRWPEKTVVLAALFAAYASFYLCRANVDASLPLLSRTFGYDKEQLGRLSSLAIGGYAVGKMSLGPLGDVVGGRRLMLLAVLGSVCASFGFGLSSSLVALTAFAAINRWFQSAGWAGVAHIAVREFEKEEHGTAMGWVSSSYEIGNALTLLLCGWLVRWDLGWRALFVVNPLLFLVIGVVTTHVIGRTATRPTPPALAGPATREESVAARIAWLLGRRPFWIALGLSFLLTFVRMGFLTWTPTFLVEVVTRHGGSVSGALLKSAVFPAAGVVGALLAGRFSDRFGPGRRAPVIAASLFVVVASVLALAHGGFADTTAILALIAVSGLFLLGPYSIVGGVVALDVGTARAASTAAGLIDFVGYVGASLTGVVLGTLAERHGWSAAFDALAFVTLAAAVLAAAWAWSVAAAPLPSKGAT
jgi:sugar phosphate permease